jgi:glycosyltransferase involved in cell wall biosynthesis
VELLLMKILQITPNYIPAWHLGGVVRHVSGLCQELVRLGHEVTVLTTDSGKYQRMSVPLNKAVEIEGVKVLYFKTDFLMKFAFSHDLGKACRTLVRNHDLVVMWAIWHYPEIPGGFYAIRERVPFVLKPSSAMMLHGLQMSRLKKWLYLNLVEFRYFRHCQGIHYSTLMERELTHPRISQLPSFIVPDGIDTTEFSELPDKAEARRQLGLPRDAFVGVFLGRLAPIKNLANLISAVDLARRQNVDVFLQLAGIDFGEKKNLESLTAQLGLEDRVYFPGYVDQEARKILLAAGDFLAYTTLQENFGIAIVEGMAAGLPVLVSDRVGIYPEVEMDRAGIVTGIEPESIAAGLVTMAGQPSQLKIMGENGRQAAAKRYDIRATAKKVERAYLDILEGVHTPDLLWSNGG